MFKIFLYLLPLVIIYILIVTKVKVKFKTFFEKGFKPNKNTYGIYCYCGKQGSGKTLSITAYCNDKINAIDSKEKLFMNIKSYNRKEYTYIDGLKDLLELRDKTDIVIVFDEIFTEISKLVKVDSQTAKDIMDFLSQMRKRRIILLTSCQEWRLLPLYFRLYCRYQINCRLIRLPLINGILLKNVIDGDNIKWDEEQQDFVGELVENVVEHTRLSVANSYDTYETISKIKIQTTKSLDTPIKNSSSSLNLPQDNASLEKKEEELLTDFWYDLSPNDFIKEKKKIIENYEKE